MTLALKTVIGFTVFFVAGIILMGIGLSWFCIEIIEPYLEEHEKEVKGTTAFKWFLLIFLGFLLFSYSLLSPMSKNIDTYTITAEVMAYNDFNTFFKTDDGNIYKTDGHYGNGIYILQMNRNNTMKVEDDYIEIVYLAVDGCYGDTAVE